MCRVAFLGGGWGLRWGLVGGGGGVGEGGVMGWDGPGLVVGMVGVVVVRAANWATVVGVSECLRLVQGVV